MRRPPSIHWLGWIPILPLLLGASALPAEGQLGARGLSLGLQGQLLQRTDQLVSPVRYSGSAWGPTLEYGFSGPRQIRSFSLALGLPTLRSELTGAGAHREEGYRGDFSLELFQRVMDFGNGAFSLFLGGELRGEFAFFDHWYSAVDRETWMYLFGLLQPGAAWSLRLPGGGELGQRITVPLGGMALRPAYQGFTEMPETVWEGPGGVTGLHHSLQYLRPLGNRGRWGVFYDLMVLRYPDPRPLALVRHGFSLRATVWNGGR